MKPKLWGLLLCLCYSMANAQSFNWNTTFGNSGVVIKTTDKPGNANYEVAESTIELADNKKLVAVYNSSVYLHRYHRNGLLDSTYGTAGRSASYNLSQPKLYRLPDGKLLLLGTEYTGTQQLKVYRLLSDGQPDRSFNNGQPVQLSFPGYVPPTLRFTSLPDGKLLVMGAIGHDYILGTPPVIYRLLATGEADLSFPSTGVVLSNIPAASLCVGMGLSNSRLMTAYIHPLRGNVVVAAYNTNGIPDSSYGTNGIIDLDIIPIQKNATLTALPDGRVLVGASVITGGGATDLRYELRCLLANGTPDNNFGIMGTARVPNSITMARGTFIFADNNGFTCAGITQSYKPFKVTYTRFNLNGVLQAAYGSNGQQHFELAVDYLYFNDGQAAPDGTITLSGRVVKSPDDYLVVSRVDANGMADQSWAADGFKLDFLASAYTYLYDPKPMPNGGLLSRYYGIGDKRQRGLLKLAANGTTDSSYGNNGLAETDADHTDTLSNGKAIAGQTLYGPSYSNARLQLTRFLANGQPDPSFGTNGVKTTELLKGFGLWLLRGLPNDKILVYGSYLDANSIQRFFACRLLPDGNLDTTFGVNGYVFFPAGKSFVARDIKVLPDGNLLLAGEIGGANNFSRMVVACLLPNGGLDPSFGSNGMVIDSTELSTYAEQLYLQPDGSFLLYHGQAMQPGNNNYYRGGLARFNNAGQRIAKFDTLIGNGGISSNLQVLADGRILMIDYAYINGNTNQLSLQLRKPDGTIDTDFGTNGTTYISGQVLGSYWYESVIAGNRLYMLGRLGSELDSKALIGLLNIQFTTAAITSFTMMDATTDRAIKPLSPSSTFNIADIRGRSINIRANVSDTTIKSVVMELSGKQTHRQVESIPAYALFGNTGNDYAGWTPAPGNYTLTATPYTGTKGTGTAGTPLTVSFTITDELTLSSLDLVNARTNTRIGALTNGATIDLAQTPDINIVALPGKGLTQSVVFGLNNNKNHKLENSAPYALASDNKGDYSRWNVKPGTYTITATPYPETRARGKAGEAKTITITIINSAVKSAIAANSLAPVLEESAGLKAGVYPNPTSGAAMLRYNLQQGSYTSIDLLDAGGARVQKLFSGTVPGGAMQQLTMQLGGLKAGVYYARIMTAHGRWQVVPIVKQ